MNFDSWALTLAVFLPAVGVVVMLAIPKQQELALKVTALVAALGVARHRHLPALCVRLQPVGRAAVRRRQALDRRDPQPVHPRSRRHLAAPADPVDGDRRAVPRLLVEPHPRARQPQGVLHPDLGARDRHERHVRRAGPHPLLRVLRGRAAADVLHDRRLGRRATSVRGDQVLPLHAVRLGAHVAELPGAVLQDRRARASRWSTSPRTRRASRTAPSS